MKQRIGLLISLVLALFCVFAGCASPAHTAEKPCVMVRGMLYYMSGEKAAEALPEGYLSAGTLEGVEGFPREDMSGSVPDGSEVYFSETRPEAVYVSMDTGYVCFTVEKLQFIWLMLDGALYLREDDFRKAYPDATGEGDFGGSLPAGAEFRGNLRGFVPDAFPSKDFETNVKAFVGYGVYALPGEAEEVYIRRDKDASGAIRFLREPAADACSGEPWRNFGMSSAGSPE